VRLGNEDAGVEHAGGVELVLEGAEDADADGADLAGEPGLVVLADGVVVGDRGAVVDDRVGGCRLGTHPLRDRVVGLLRGDGEVERGAGLVDV
jgi:hypothetical protein